MKRLFVQLTILAAFVLAVPGLVAAEDFAPEGVNSMSILPTEAPAGYDISVYLNATLDAGFDGTTGMCIYFPVSDGNPVISPPASFIMEYGEGMEATFYNTGKCFTFSEQIAIQYEASGLPAGPMTYQGGLTGTIRPTTQPGTYLWSVSVFEPTFDGPGALSAQNGVMAPTAITLGSAGLTTGTILPAAALLAVALLTMSTLLTMALHTRPIPIRRR